MTPIASLGCDTLAPCADNRKFMFGPDVVEENGMYVLLLGSGDREKPLRAWPHAFSVSNRFYMLVDKPYEDAWLKPPADQPTQCNGAGLLCHESLLAIANNGPTPAPADLAAKKGWYLTLAIGEQVVTSSVTAYGITTFNTHIPTDAATTRSCKSDLGTANVYNVSYADAGVPQGSAARFTAVDLPHRR
jgi:type IV pilus assembly protein PilY1